MVIFFSRIRLVFLYNDITIDVILRARGRSFTFLTNMSCNVESIWEWLLLPIIIKYFLIFNGKYMKII